LALFGRRPPQRVDSIVMPASENLHRSGSYGRYFVCSDIATSSRAGTCIMALAPHDQTATATGDPGSVVD